MTTIKAIQVHQYGPPSELRLEEVTKPVAGEGQLLVRVVAAGVNPIDWKFRAGYLKEMIPVSLPWVPGFDFSGVIEQVGEGVSGFSSGDSVFGKSAFPAGGSYAEFVVVSADDAVHKNASITHVDAAAIPAGGLTAWQGLFGGGPLELKAGQSVLILGAAGGVGGFAVQLAKRHGAKVIAAGRAASEEYLIGLGADKFLDTASGDLSPAGDVDFVLDLVGGELHESAWKQVKSGGVFVSTLDSPSESEAKSRGVHTALIFTQTNTEQLRSLADLVANGDLNVDVRETYRLDQASIAHERLEGHGVFGKIVLTV